MQNVFAGGRFGVFFRWLMSRLDSFLVTFPKFVPRRPFVKATETFKPQWLEKVRPCRKQTLLCSSFHPLDIFPYRNEFRGLRLDVHLAFRPYSQFCKLEQNSKAGQFWRRISATSTPPTLPLPDSAECGEGMAQTCSNTCK